MEVGVSIDEEAASAVEGSHTLSISGKIVLLTESIYTIPYYQSQDEKSDCDIEGWFGCGRRGRASNK